MAWKFFKNVWAQSGTVAPIPEDAQLDGSVSYDEGFPFDYQREIGVDPDAKPIPRGQFNELMNALTSMGQQYQTLGFPFFITSAENGGSPYPYDIDAHVRYDDGVNGFRTYYSLVTANTSLPTDTTKWGVVRYTQGEETGVGKDFYGSVLPSGYVWGNGTTIGNASSNATQRANADTLPLFTALWNANPQTTLPVRNSSGVIVARGISAAVDFAANRQITLPDKRDVVTIGRTDMGGTSARGLVTQIETGLNPATMCATGGAQSVGLTSNENGPHVHTATSGNNGSHFHSGNTNSANANATFLGFASTGSPGASGTNLIKNSFGGTGYPMYNATGSEGQTATYTAPGNHSHAFSTDNAGTHNHTIDVQSSGVGETHQNMQPTMVCNYIIKL